MDHIKYQSREALPEQWRTLMEAAKELLAQVSSARQAVAVLTGNNRYCQASGNPMEDWEAGLAETLAMEQDARVRYLVCMWEDGTLDVPSARLRALLMASAENQETQVLLQGAQGYTVKTLRDIGA
ncbi:MAG TPA: hypothetical protein IAC31_06755 [Candidatus Faecousia intestinigallinarum]|nr:hypothetical protein [Candidatus Faecousia intestinigallinarum]